MHHSYLSRDSFLPLTTSINIWLVLTGLIDLFESGIFTSDNSTLSGLSGTILPVMSWITEYKHEWHTGVYSDTCFEAQNVKLGFALSIVPEIMFLLSPLSPHPHNSIWVLPEFFGFTRPAANIPVLPSFPVALPLTVLLLTPSGTTNVAILGLLVGDELLALMYTLFTIVLGGLFTSIQSKEYNELIFGINDGISGSVFPMITGLHGFHVFLGLCMISLCWVYFSNNSYVPTHSNKRGYVFPEVSAWYWHFVDVVWLLVYTRLYDWRVSHGVEFADSHKTLLLFTN